MGLQQGGDKHGAIRDDVIKRETAIEFGGLEAFLEDRRESEPDGQGEPADLALENEAVGGAPGGMTPAEVAARTELARSLQPSVFPASQQRLVESATELRAPDRVVRALGDLPREQVYRNVQQVWQGLGGGGEDTAHRA
jgi:hypothetical protein